jgi:electron-transferring-flavoprotein dehydrogenase
VHLNYENPYLFPYMEFQRFKHHPMVAELLRAESASPMARAPFPKAAGSRCPRPSRPVARSWAVRRGLVNVPRIKGNHNAMLSGIEAAEAAAIARGRSGPATS